MIFDINSAGSLFFLINRTMERFSGEREKDVTELLFLIMALNHLREWIAPGYGRNRDGNWPDPDNDGEQFSQDIYDKCPEFETIRKLCNRTKHIKPITQNTDSENGLPIDEWRGKIDDVADFDKGPAINYFVDDENVIHIINTVIDFYKIEWFEKK